MSDENFLKEMAPWHKASSESTAVIEKGIPKELNPFLSPGKSCTKCALPSYGFFTLYNDAYCEKCCKILKLGKKDEIAEVKKA